MTQRGPWSVKGIDNRAREAAREAAREEGMTLGAYLNKLILEEDPSQNGPAVGVSQNERASRPPPSEPLHRSAAETHSAPSSTSLDRLTRRIESAEARSTLAITGIDQSVVGLLSRLENAEHNQQAMGGHFEGIIDDIAKTYEALNVKVKHLETDESSATNLRALKALEDALGKLASHVYTENELAGEETNAIKARLEFGLGELSERVDAFDNQIEKKLDKASEGISEALKMAESRAEGTNQHLAERFSAVELNVADKLSHVDDMSSTMDTVHEDVTNSLTEMNDTLGKMQERLSRAETVTDKAMHSLETRLETLDTRLADVQKFANEGIEKKFQERFESLSEDLRQLVASTRAELAEEIEAAASSVDAEVIESLNGAISTINARLDSSEDLHAQTVEMVGNTVTRITDSVDQRLTANQEQQGRAIEQVSQQVSRISDGLDQRLESIETFNGKAENDALREEIIRFTNTLDERLEYLESNEDAAFEKVSTEVEKIADRLEERIATSEAQSASAIEQVGEQVSTVTNRLEQRQAEALKAFAAKLDGSQKRQDARLTGALSNVSDRLERIQEQSLVSMSPVQKAISALAQRLEAVEDFSAPPYSDRAEAPSIPAMISPSKVDTNLATQTTLQDFEDTIESSFEIEDTEFSEAPAFEDANIQKAFEAETESLLNQDISSETEEKIEEEISIETYKDTDFLTTDLEVELSSDLTETVATETAKTVESDSAEGDDFEPGYMNWTDDANAVLDDTLGMDDIELADDDELQMTDLSLPMPDPVEADPVWHDGREEARDTDIFDDVASAFQDDLQTGFQPSDHSEYGETDASINAFEATASAVDKEGSQEETEEKGDYISQARRAARDAATVAGTTKTGQKTKTKKTSSPSGTGINPKHAGIAALAAVAVAGTAGVLYMRGQDKAQSVDFNTEADADRLAVLTNNALDASTVSSETNIDTATTDASEALQSDATPDGTSIEAENTEGTLAGNTADTELSGNTQEATATVPEAATSIPEPTPVAAAAPVRAAFTAPQIPARASVNNAAGQGNAIAQFQTGMADLRAGNFEDSANWLSKASDKGLAMAQHELAILHENGTGIARDPSEARRLHAAAANGGHVEAMYDVATYNANGEGGEANLQAAAEWFRKAAEYGHADSQYNLAQLYTLGSGVSPSQIEALYWFEVAAVTNNDTDARLAANELVSSGAVSAEAAAKVRQRVNSWRKATPAPIANGRFGPQSWENNSKERVVAVQRVLLALGYSVGTPDGVSGTQTQNAIKIFEQAAGIPVTGKINDRLVENLNKAADAERSRA